MALTKMCLALCGYILMLICKFNLVASFNLEEPASKNAVPSLNSNTTLANATSDSSKGSETETEVQTEDTSLDDRFNLNYNVAGAKGVGRYGGVSESNSMSYGINAGIRRKNGHYQNLYSNSGAKSNSYSYGPGAPLTYANTGTRYRPGYGGGGYGSSGIYGGRGNAYAHSHTQRIEIPLDNMGTVLLSNLKERNNTDSAISSLENETDVVNSSSNAPFDTDKTEGGNPDAIVFS